MGDNKYGQLGRGVGGGGRGGKDPVLEEMAGGLEGPRPVAGILGDRGSGCCDIDCGWSHCVALVREEDEGGKDGDVVDGRIMAKTVLYGWGRNDRGQLGTGCRDNESAPRRLLPPGRDAVVSCEEEGAREVWSSSCGAESTIVLDAGGNVYGTGWNEHGNLSIGEVDDNVCEFTKIQGARIIRPPSAVGLGEMFIAAGGAHMLAMLI